MLLIVIYSVLLVMFGWFIMKTMVGMNISQFMGTDVWDSVLEWIIVMGVSSFVIMIGKSIAMILLSRVAERVVNGTRMELYEAVLRKDIGWHDHRENSSGIMTSTLSSDVQMLNGVSSDGLAVMTEAVVCLLFAVGFSMYWSWPMACVALVATPLIMICGAITAKADMDNQMGMEEQETENEKSDDAKESQILATDSITNYKTVASFGND